jgi:hypothetical protein
MLLLIIVLGFSLAALLLNLALDVPYLLDEPERPTTQLLEPRHPTAHWDFEATYGWRMESNHE